MPKESKADSSVSNSKGTSTKYSDFDLNGLKLQDADKVIKTDIRKGSVYHVPAEYKGDDSFRISTLMCYVSGAYRMVFVRVVLQQLDQHEKSLFHDVV